MRTTGFRSMVLYLLLACFVGGVVYLGVNLFLHGGQWAMQPYNGHISSSLGNISDRSGNVLATSTEEGRTYSDSETVRRALLHTVGDPYGYISTSVEYTMRDKLTGYNLITGLNDTIFNRMGSDIALTVDQDACAAAYNALGGKNGAVLVYNYFLRRLKLTAADLDDFAHDFYSLAQKSAFRVIVHPSAARQAGNPSRNVKEAS